MDSADIESTLIKFTPGAKMAKFIASEVAEMGVDADMPKGVRAFLDSDDDAKAQLLLKDLKWVKSRLALRGRFLCQLLPGTDLVLPSPPVQVRSPVLEARCQRLRREQDERDYRAMTKMVDPIRFRQPEDSISYQMKQINRQLIGVLQFVFSVAAGFMFGFLGLELIFGGLEMGFRLLAGISCALVIAVAEIYFLIKHLNEADAVPEELPVAGSDTKQHRD